MSIPDPNAPAPPPVQEPEPVDLQAVAINTLKMANCGDHAEVVTTVLRYIPGETVEALVARAFPQHGTKWGRHDHGDAIVLRIPEPLPEPVPAASPDPWAAAAAELKF